MVGDLACDQFLSPIVNMNTVNLLFNVLETPPVLAM